MLVGSILAVHVGGQVLLIRHHLDERIATGIDNKLNHIPVDIEIFPLIKREVFDGTHPDDHGTQGFEQRLHN